MDVIALEGNGSRPSHRGGGYSEDGRMFTLNTIEKHAVCYGISRSMLKGGENGGGIPMGENLQPGITANGFGAVCYAIVKLKNDGNPFGGCHETNVSSTLDANGTYPNCEQGGVLIIEPRSDIPS